MKDRAVTLFYADWMRGELFEWSVPLQQDAEDKGLLLAWPADTVIALFGFFTVFFESLCERNHIGLAPYSFGFRAEH